MVNTARLILDHIVERLSKKAENRILSSYRGGIISFTPHRPPENDAKVLVVSADNDDVHEVIISILEGNCVVTILYGHLSTRLVESFSLADPECLEKIESFVIDKLG